MWWFSWMLRSLWASARPERLMKVTEYAKGITVFQDNDASVEWKYWNQEAFIQSFKQGFWAPLRWVLWDEGAGGLMRWERLNGQKKGELERDGGCGHDSLRESQRGSSNSPVDVALWKPLVRPSCWYGCFGSEIGGWFWLAQGGIERIQVGKLDVNHVSAVRTAMNHSSQLTELCLALNPSFKPSEWISSGCLPQDRGPRRRGAARGSPACCAVLG